MYLRRHVFVAPQVRLSLQNAPHDGTQKHPSNTPPGVLRGKWIIKYILKYTTISTSSQENSRDKTAGFDDIDADKVIRQGQVI